MSDLSLAVPVQFEMECRPFYVSGFNAHDLVPKSLATPSEHRTVGRSCAPSLFTLYTGRQSQDDCLRAHDILYGKAWRGLSLQSCPCACWIASSVELWQTVCLSTDMQLFHPADNKMGLDLIREMFANATKWKMNTVRLYAHTTDPEHPFMVKF